MISYFYGEDTFAAREAIAELSRQEKAPVRFVATDQLDERTWREVLQGSAGLFGKELIVIRDPSQLPKLFQEMIVEAADAPPHGIVVLWDQEEPPQSSPVFVRLRKEARVFPSLPAAELTRWLMAEATRRGFSLSHAPAAALVERLGSDRYRLLSELERLSLSTREISLEHVDTEVVPAHSEGEIFELLKVVTAGKREQALREFQALLGSGVSELYVVSMLAYQFRTLYLLSRDWQQGISPRAAQALLVVAKRRPAAAWLADLTRVVATDFAIKQGNVDMRTGVTMLILSLLGEKAQMAKAQNPN